MSNTERKEYIEQLTDITDEIVEHADDNVIDILNALDIIYGTDGQLALDCLGGLVSTARNILRLKRLHKYPDSLNRLTD